jgi:hypothetical protein
VPRLMNDMDRFRLVTDVIVFRDSTSAPPDCAS